MSQLIADDLMRIRQFLEMGDFYQANQLVKKLEDIPITSEDEIRVLIYKAIVEVNLGHVSQAMQIITKLVNSITEWSKSIQLHILHVASQVTLSAGNTNMTKIYLDKFADIFSNISPILQDKANSTYADVTNVEGLFKFSQQNYETALDRFEEAVKLQRKLDKPYQYAIAMYNAGKTANELNKPSRAELYLVDALNLFREIEYLEGQLQCVDALVDTYKLQGDESSATSFQTISKELKHRVEFDELRRQSEKRIEKLQRDNDDLRVKLASVESQRHGIDKAQEKLEEELSHLREKVKDYDELKPVFSDLKEQLVTLELQVSRQKKEINKLSTVVDEQQENINSQNETILRQKKKIEELETENRKLRVELKTKSPTQERPSDLTVALNELLSSSKLVDAIHEKLVDAKTAKIKILAMQARISTEKCIEAVKQLEEVGVIEVDSWNFASPTVTYIN